MSDNVEKINTELSLKHDLLESVDKLVLIQVADNESINFSQAHKISIDSLKDIGVTFAPLIEIITKLNNKSGVGKSGIYRVSIPPGTKLGQFKNKNAYFGTAITSKGFDSAAKLTSIATRINPIMIAMAVMVYSIEKKISSIEEKQEEVMNFLLEKEQSKLRGNLLFLMDISKNFKYNLTNEKYKESNHIKVLDIKQTSESKIDFFRNNVLKSIRSNKKDLSNKKIERLSIKLQGQLKDYQLSIYLYAYSSFLDVMLLENYDERYLNSITEKIRTYAYNYRELYTEIYDYIDYSIKNGTKLGNVSNFIEESAVNLTSKLRKSKKRNINKQKKKIAENRQEIHLERLEEIMKPLIDQHSSDIKPFVDSIDEINRLYNKTIDMYVDKSAIYVSS